MKWIVEIEWIDPCSSYGWGADQKCEPAKCYSVGILISSDAKCVRVAQTWGEMQDAADILIVPRGCVRKLRRIGKRRMPK